MTWWNVFIVAVYALVTCVALLTGFAYMTWLERRCVARIQWRVGPNRVGPFGLLQPLADGIKLLFKEQLMPKEARPFLFLVAPCISLVVALAAFAVIPVGLPGFPIAKVNVAVLYLLGVGSLGVYGIVLGGWSSGNKYSLLGAVRSSAQMISYELALGAALLSPIMMVGSLSFEKVTAWQSGWCWHWMVCYQPLAFILYCIAAVAETNRAPFDLPEAEQELGAGYHTEYSGMRFSLFFMAEYTAMITQASVAAVVFLGGGSGPLGFLWFLLKVLFFMFVYIWLRATLPRFRYDQLMRIGWQVLLPLGFLNLLVTTLGVALGWSPWTFTWVILGLVVLLVMFGKLSRGGASATGHPASHG